MGGVGTINLRGKGVGRKGLRRLEYPSSMKLVFFLDFLRTFIAQFLLQKNVVSEKFEIDVSKEMFFSQAVGRMGECILPKLLLWLRRRFQNTCG